jgi:hypothetical protein
MHENTSYTSHTQKYPPVATSHRSPETGTSSTPLRLPLGSTHTTTQAIEYNVMTTRTKMTKLLSMSKLLLWPKRALLSVLFSHCTHSRWHFPSCETSSLVHELIPLKWLCQHISVHLLSPLVHDPHLPIVHALLGPVVTDGYVASAL